MVRDALREEALDCICDTTRCVFEVILDTLVVCFCFFGYGCG
jgi:hypothetical protein